MLLSWFKKIYCIIFPDSCAICYEITYSYGICYECWKKITFLHTNACNICYRQLNFDPEGPCLSCIRKKPSFTLIRSSMKYDEYTKRLILNFKNRQDFYLLKFLVDRLEQLIDDLKIDVIIPVPMHYMRRIMRGYNQASMLAKTLADRKNLKFSDKILIKTKHTKSQGNLNKKQRNENLRNTFKTTINLAQKSILLIDDVITTGSTIEKCSAELKKAGAKNIYCISVCKV